MMESQGKVKECKEMTSERRAEKALQLSALSHSSDALWFVVEQYTGNVALMLNITLL